MFYDEPVRCPQCGAGPGRQEPVYAGHGDGWPYATGMFCCHRCGETYRPNTESGIAVSNQSRSHT
jgi:hypothetical protein